MLTIADLTEEESAKSHIVNFQVLLRIKDRNIQHSTFSEAALIVALRQEIFIANLLHKPLDDLPSYCNFDKNLVSAPDAIWTWRMIACAAAISNMIYRDSPTRSAWAAHTEYLTQWRQKRPGSFDMLFEDTDPVPCFPRMWYASHVHLAGQQYHNLAKIMLTMTDPYVPAIGIASAEARRRNSSRVRKLVRETCGAALASNEWFPALLNAGLAIALGGEMFWESREQKALMSILETAEQHLGWSSLRTGSRLRNLWNTMQAQHE